MAETLVEALYRVDVGCGYDCRLALAVDADILLPILARFASPEVKAAVLRTLLGERLDEDGVMDALSDAHENGFPSKHWVRRILAPEATDGK